MRSMKKLIPTDAELTLLRKRILAYYRAYGRHGLPWRQHPTPYQVLVSELMLQQTQVDRVIPKFNAFMMRFPDVHELAEAPLSAVLQEWQGLGYNRRAKFLHEVAKAVVLRHRGLLPRDRPLLEALPGIGHYTAGAVRVFAYDESDDFIETNIRTVLTHHLFPRRRVVSDDELLSILPRVRGRSSPRAFYAAMMDYGTHLKAKGVRINHKRKGYKKQKPFEGSLRQVRGAVLRALVAGKTVGSLRYEERQVHKAVADLTKEGLIVAKGGNIILAK